MLLRNSKPSFSLSFLSHTLGWHCPPPQHGFEVHTSEPGTHSPNGHSPRVSSHIWTGMSKVTGLGKGLIRTESRSLISSTMWVSLHHTSCLQPSSAAKGDPIACIDASWRDAVVYIACVSQVTFGGGGGVILFYFFNGHTVKLTFLLLAWSFMNFNICIDLYKTTTINRIQKSFITPLRNPLCYFFF